MDPLGGKGTGQLDSQLLCLPRVEDYAVKEPVLPEEKGNSPVEAMEEGRNNNITQFYALPPNL